MASPKNPHQGLFDFTYVERSAPPLPPPAAVVNSPRAEPIGIARSEAKAEAKTYSVADLVRAASRALEARFTDVWVEGEVSNLSTPRSGHLYFTLKDEAAQLPSVMFRTQAARLGFELEDGLRVRARGRLSIYDAQGKFQFYAEALEPAGLGALQLAFEQLKRKLDAEGLFAAARKRPLPAWPKLIGVATSPTGAVIRDILRVAERRGRARFLIAPCQVQGTSAAAEICAAVKTLEGYPGVDVILVARGGGSAEDLAAFNDEALARVIANCRVPVVSAVGHEVDFTIADFVADVRAPTPSAAAEIIVPLFADAERGLEEANRRLLRAGTRTLGDARQRLDTTLDQAAQSLRIEIHKRRGALDHQIKRLSALHPQAQLHRNRGELAALEKRLFQCTQTTVERQRRKFVELSARVSVARALEKRRRDFASLAGKLDAMSPLAVLERGYSLARRKDGHVISDAKEVVPGDVLTLRLSRGEVECVVDWVALATGTSEDSGSGK